MRERERNGLSAIAISRATIMTLLAEQNLRSWESAKPAKQGVSYPKQSKHLIYSMAFPQNAAPNQSIYGQLLANEGLLDVASRTPRGLLKLHKPNWHSILRGPPLRFGAARAKKLPVLNHELIFGNSTTVTDIFPSFLFWHSSGPLLFLSTPSQISGLEQTTGMHNSIQMEELFNH